MNVKLILAAPCLALLAACGGSSDGSSTNPTTTNPVVLLQTFGDGTTKLRTRRPGSGKTFISMVSNELTDNIATQGYVRSNNYGDFHLAAATTGGTPVYGFYYNDFSEPVDLMYLTGNGKAFVGVSGSDVSNIPSGSYSYTGTNIIGVRGTDAVNLGYFTMNVNFTSGTASLAGSTFNGSTPSSSIAGSGISINSSDGTFTSNDLTLITPSSNNSATIHGNFHGSGATGVTALYTDNARTPVFVGAIVGTR